MLSQSKRLALGAIPLLLAAHFAVAVSGPASAAPFPPSTPVVTSDLTPNPSGKIAEPSDDVAHPGVTTEWWYAGFMDPNSKRQIVLAIFTAPVPVVTAMMMYGDETSPFSFAQGLPNVTWPHGGAVADGEPGIRTNVGEITFDAARHAYHVRVDAGFKADIWLDRGALPGITEVMDIKNQGQWMGWSNPVATSFVTGNAQFPGGAQVDVTGWRGYHDHNWGNFTMVDQAVDGWEWGVSHEPDGGASIIGGLVRRGGQWTGSVVDVRPSGTRACYSSTIDLSDWTSGSSYLSGSTFSIPGTITATCGPAEKYPFTKTFHLTEPLVADAGVVALSLEAPYSTIPGSRGMFEHVRSLLARYEQAQRSGG